MECLADIKKELRRRIREARRALSVDERAEASLIVQQRVAALDRVADAVAVMVYAASPEELSLDTIALQLSDEGVTLGYPRVEGPYEMSIRWVDPRDPESFVGGSFGIREPVAHSPFVDPSLIDVVLTPGLAFTRDGRRMGYGGGFYDNLLPKLRKDCVRVGVCFDEQLVDDLPCEDRDERVDVVITPSGTWVTGVR